MGPQSRRLSVLVTLLAASTLAGTIAPASPVSASPSFAGTPTWIVASNGLALDVPASWRVWGPTAAVCPSPGGSVYLDQLADAPAPNCQAIPASTTEMMVLVGPSAPGTPTGRSAMIDGLEAHVTVTFTGGVMTTAVFPQQTARVVVSLFGPAPSKAARRSVVSREFKILETVRLAKQIYTDLPLPTGPPLALHVISVTRGLEPYDPTLSNQGKPIEVVRFHLAVTPTSGFICQTAVRRYRTVVGVNTGDYGGPPGPGQPLPPGYSHRDQAAGIQLSVPTFKGEASDASVVCRPD